MSKPIDNEEIKLTVDQKTKIVERWNDRNLPIPSVPELVLLAFKIEEDGYGKYGLSIRRFLADQKLKNSKKPSLERRINAPSELTEEQMLYISNNISLLKPIEICRYLFDNEKLNTLSSEYKLVIDYVNSLPDQVRNAEPVENADGLGKYKPPTTPMLAARRVNKFILNAVKLDDIEKNSKLQNCLTQFIRFCHMPRFVLTFEQYGSQEEKNLFESSYVRYVWDKPDLTEEELDIYVNLCADIVSLTKMGKEETYLLSLRDDCAEDTEGKRISMSIVQNLADLRKEMNDSRKRIKDTAESLSGKRNQRIDMKVKENASLVQLIDFWRTYENRQQMIRLAEARKKSLKEEIQRIETMSDLIMEVHGIGKDEALLASI